MAFALIVEDEPQANKLLATLVRMRGYTTESALTGKEALDLAGTRVPDVVFLDLMLPDIDGYQVCRALKRSGETSQVPVVIVTARIASENRIESFHAGADDYIPKPYTPDQIFEALDETKDRDRDSAAEGLVMLDGRDDGQTLRRLARLRSLLHSVGGLGPDAVESIGAVIGAIWESVDRWARRSGQDRVAALAYSLSREWLVLTVHDEAEWLASLGDLAEGPLSDALAGAAFDRVECDHSAHCLRLAKRFNDR